MRLVALETLSPYLFMHMKNIQIVGPTCHVHQFEAKVVRYSELDSKSDSAILNWIGSPPWRAKLLGSPTAS
jgi:hypothetical protein